MSSVRDSQSLGLFNSHFADRSVVVTGAARGMGFAIAEAFAVAGGTVLLTDREPSVEAAADTLRKRGLKVSYAVFDVVDETTAGQAVRAFGEEQGKIDVLINNAGVISVENMNELTKEEFNRILQVNTVAPFIMAKESLPWLRQSPNGVILNAASGQARQGFIYTPHYAASKFGVMGMTQSLAKELAPNGIRVNAYCPGIVRTDMWDYLDVQWGRRLGNYAPGELIDTWISEIPLKRPAENSDIANLLLFLASDAATYITGQTINIDGGMFMS
ncbi:SDR family NAD(P)-dependent oxidoreductase [Pseudarthrobacter oxydans]|uniref:SDR family NAD(P)-dependent oxidoreductase n=1 Tax=Pseudarthrobacter oxydans TaxID=1671 RepID=UPI003D2B0270